MSEMLTRAMLGRELGKRRQPQRRVRCEAQEIIACRAVCGTGETAKEIA